MFSNSVDHYSRLKKIALRHNHRYVMLLDGQRESCVHAAQAIWQSSATGTDAAVWLGSGPDPAENIRVKPHRYARNLLGQEFDLAVFNGFDGISLSALAAVAGTIRGGGVLLLLLPDLEQLERFQDPALLDLTGLPPEQLPATHPFLARLKGLLERSDVVWRLSDLESNAAMHAATEMAESTATLPVPAPFKTAEQQQVTVRVVKQASARARRPVVLMADRGRGKSSALGIAAAQLMQSRPSRILVTAPSSAAVIPLFQMAGELTGKGESRDVGDLGPLQIDLQHSSLKFVAPDLLLQTLPECDLLLVDEAAAIPAPMLAQMVSQYARVVFSTTVHGYEGTGRGFAVRFFNYLDEQMPAWQLLKMSEPVRWAPNDPLERLLFDALLLDADSPKQQDVNINASELTYSLLQGTALQHDEHQLRQICGLLICAHYQTRPEDIRAILDNPKLFCVVQKYQQQVTGVALVLREGPLADEQLEDIWLNQRRPRGHLLPVSLSAQLGIRLAPSLRYARVMRIAVHPELQRKGLGSLLLQQIPGQIEHLSCDVLGTSFAASTELLPFWLSAGYQPVRLGFQRDASSGEHSAMMLNPLTSLGAEVAKHAMDRFRADFAECLNGPLKDIDPELACILLTSAWAGHANALSAVDSQMLQAFTQGNRSRDDCLGALRRFTQVLAAHNRLSGLDAALMVAASVQYRDEPWLIKHFAMSGKKALLQALRRSLRQALDVVSLSVY